MRHVLRGNPGLVVKVAPFVALVVLAKLALELTDTHPFDLNPLLSGVIAANVFLLGFLLAGTGADFKEAERIPGEIAATLDSIADECRIVHVDKGVPEAKACVEHLRRLSRSIRETLVANRPIDEPLRLLRELNPYFLVFTPLTLAGFVTRQKTDQSNVRKMLIRVDAIRTTSFVSAGYLVAELVGFVLITGMLLHDFGDLPETLVLVGTISFLLLYVAALIRDLDNPFEYRGGVPGPADVSLAPLEQFEARIDRELPEWPAPRAQPVAATGS